MRLMSEFEKVVPQFHVWIWFRSGLGKLCHHVVRATLPEHIMRRADGLRGILIAALYAWDLWEARVSMPKYEDGLCAPCMDDGGLVTTMVITLVVLLGFNGLASSYMALAAMMCATNYTTLALPLAHVALFVAASSGGWALAGSLVGAALGGVWQYRCFDVELLTRTSGATLAIMVGVAHVMAYCAGFFYKIACWYVYLLCCCGCCGVFRRRARLSRPTAPAASTRTTPLLALAAAPAPAAGRPPASAVSRALKRRAPAAPPRPSCTRTPPPTTTGRSALP